MISSVCSTVVRRPSALSGWLFAVVTAASAAESRVPNPNSHPHARPPIIKRWFPGIIYEIDDTREFWWVVLLTKDVPVYVYLYSPNCGVCYRQEADIAQLAIERPDIVIVKVNVRRFPDIALSHRTTMVPDHAIWYNQQVLHRMSGFLSVADLSDVLGAIVGPCDDQADRDH